MAIPGYQEFMLPLLMAVADRHEHDMHDLYNQMAEEFNLSEEDQNELLPSGKQFTLQNRISWARTYLKKAGLLESPGRGFIKITEEGLKVLQNPPSSINVKFLNQFSDFQIFREKKDTDETEISDDIEISPQETLEKGYQLIRNALVSDLLEKLKSVSPARFEKLVVELVVKMGYGGSLKDAGKAVGKSGDGGIDGIIKEDRLGLDAIYIQAKRWEGTVSRPEIQKFAGALQMHRARKGIFITTDFSKEAKEFVQMIDSKIVLIDGNELAQYMSDFNLGVTTEWVYEIKRIDSDYFEEE